MDTRKRVLGSASVLCPIVVGRDAELQALRTAVGAAADGAGGLVFVTGGPGIGKSRLVRELADCARVQGVAVAAGRAVPAGVSTPFRPLTEALLQALRDRSFPDDADLAPWLPALNAIIPTTGGAGLGDSPAVRGEAVLRLLRRLAEPGALMVVLEDLHWSDPDTLSVVEYLADNLANDCVLCVATSRNEPPSAALDLVRRLWGRRGSSHLSLGRLDDHQVAAMVRACVPGAGDDLIGDVRHAAEGVPFLVEEVLASPGVPRSFADTVQARMSALGDEERVVLWAAAVLGRHFDWRLLPAATGLALDVISGALERGVGSLLLTVDGNRFRFRHALTREAVVDGLLPPRRAPLPPALFPRSRRLTQPCLVRGATSPPISRPRPVTGIGLAPCWPRLARSPWSEAL